MITPPDAPPPLSTPASAAAPRFFAVTAQGTICEFARPRAGAHACALARARGPGSVLLLRSALAPSPFPAAEFLARDPYLKTLNFAVEAGGLTGALNGKGPFTLFAPVSPNPARLFANTVRLLCSLNTPATPPFSTFIVPAPQDDNAFDAVGRNILDYLLNKDHLKTLDDVRVAARVPRLPAPSQARRPAAARPAATSPPPRPPARAHPPALSPRRS